METTRPSSLRIKANNALSLNVEPATIHIVSLRSTRNGFWASTVSFPYCGIQTASAIRALLPDW
jgi:hypothetical protein